MSMPLRVKLGRLAAGAACWTAATFPCTAADALPEPLTLEAALDRVPGNLPAEILAGQYAETAVRARAYECRAPDSSGGAPGIVSAECGYWHLLTPGQQSRLDVMARFLDVVEADLATARDNEAMAVAYVEVDRARNRAELGQFSALEVAELDVAYQRARGAYVLSQARQRATRALLAIAMGRPDELASEVTGPSPDAVPKGLPDVDELTSEAVAGNPVLAGWRSRAEDDHLLVPLATQVELDLRKAVLELWLSHGILLARRDTAVSEQAFRDISLDYNRTLYELEAKADLGDTMTRQTAARLARLVNDHQVMLVHATLNALRGREVFPLEPAPE